MLWIRDDRGIKFFENLLLFVIGQVTDWLFLDNPLAPLVFRNVVAQSFRIPADLVELSGPEADCDVFDSAFPLKLNPAG